MQILSVNFDNEVWNEYARLLGRPL